FSASGASTLPSRCSRARNVSVSGGNTTATGGETATGLGATGFGAVFLWRHAMKNVTTRTMAATKNSGESTGDRPRYRRSLHDRQGDARTGLPAQEPARTAIGSRSDTTRRSGAPGSP